MERGMVENELILKSFQNDHLQSMNSKELAELETFLDETDPDIYSWLSGRVPFPEEYADSIGARLMDYIKNQYTPRIRNTLKNNT
uniref:FAD assembly factor SdhE n=1 Tax=Arcella intermedia TaxID=1963864 RepID=A0A6B2LVD2_9EUKA